jgi:hypothetical protein
VLPKKKSRAAPKRVKKEDASEAESDAKVVPKKKSRAAPKGVKKEDDSDAESASDVIPKKRTRGAPKMIQKEDEDEAEAETATKAKNKKPKAGPTKVKNEISKHDGLSADDAPLSKISGRQGGKKATRVKAEQPASGEEDEGGSEIEHEVTASRTNKGKKANSKVSGTTRVKKEEGDSDAVFEESDKPKARSGRGSKISKDSAVQAPAKQVKTKGITANVFGPDLQAMASYSLFLGPSNSLQQSLGSLDPSLYTLVGRGHAL